MNRAMVDVSQVIFDKEHAILNEKNDTSDAKHAKLDVKQTVLDMEHAMLDRNGVGNLFFRHETYIFRRGKCFLVWNALFSI